MSGILTILPAGSKIVAVRNNGEFEAELPDGSMRYCSIVSGPDGITAHLTDVRQSGEIVTETKKLDV